MPRARTLRPSTTTASQRRSWVGIYAGDPPDPPTLPPDADWGTIDSMGFAGNWMIRGSGVTGTGGADAIPWLSETPISGTVATGGTRERDAHLRRRYP